MSQKKPANSSVWPSVWSLVTSNFYVDAMVTKASKCESSRFYRSQCHSIRVLIKWFLCKSIYKTKIETPNKYLCYIIDHGWLVLSELCMYLIDQNIYINEAVISIWHCFYTMWPTHTQSIHLGNRNKIHLAMRTVLSLMKFFRVALPKLKWELITKVCFANFYIMYGRSGANMRWAGEWGQNWFDWLFSQVCLYYHSSYSLVMSHSSHQYQINFKAFFKHHLESLPYMCICCEPQHITIWGEFETWKQHFSLVSWCQRPLTSIALGWWVVN